MQPQINNKVVSSFLLYLDHTVTKNGLAFTNNSGLFYNIPSKYANTFTYSSRFQPLVSDSSIPGAIVMSGIYLNGSFLTTGQSGFLDIDYKRGYVYFSSPVTGTLSGNYAIKDYNFSLTNDSEISLLFENKQFLRPKVGQVATGIYTDETTFPSLYIRDNGSYNEGFAFGGLKETYYNIRVITVADSQFLLDATNSLLRDTFEKYVPLFEAEEMPYNSRGGLKSGVFNYTGITNGKPPHLWIKEAFLTKLSQNVRTDTNSLNNDVFVGFGDFTICQQRQV